MNRLHQNEIFKAFTFNEIRPHPKDNCVMDIKFFKDLTVQLFSKQYYKIVKLKTTKINYYFDFEDFYLLMYLIFQHGKGNVDQISENRFFLKKVRNSFSVKYQKSELNIKFTVVNARKILVECHKFFYGFILWKCEKYSIYQPRRAVEMFLTDLKQNLPNLHLKLRNTKCLSSSFCEIFNFINSNKNTFLYESFHYFEDTPLMKYLIIYFSICRWKLHVQTAFKLK